MTRRFNEGSIAKQTRFLWKRSLHLMCAMKYATMTVVAMIIGEGLNNACLQDRFCLLGKPIIPDPVIAAIAPAFFAYLIILAGYLFVSFASYGFDQRFYQKDLIKEIRQDIKDKEDQLGHLQSLQRGAYD